MKILLWVIAFVLAGVPVPATADRELPAVWNNVSPGEFERREQESRLREIEIRQQQMETRSLAEREERATRFMRLEQDTGKPIETQSRPR
jgi:hypothetical protein